MFSQYEDVATVTRLGTYSGDKSSYAAVGNPVEGFLAPISADMNTVGVEAFSQTYQFVCDGEEDIQDNDILTIDSVEYGVKGTSIFKMCSMLYLRCMVEKSVKGT